MANSLKMKVPYFLFYVPGLVLLFPQLLVAQFTPNKERDVMQKNGFTLNNLLIPADEIHSGGPPKDGIPSIDRPQFMAARFAKFIGEEEYVLGVHLNGVAKAYPIKIMDRHEVVNDRFDTTGVAVTYCPLCGSGIAFKADFNGQAVEFGVSGLLYNSDVLLYDRQTESLWSQIESQAIAGPSSGQKLEIIPTSFMTWQQWKERFPNTIILTTDTGFPVDYNKKAYMGYEASSQIFFPVANKSNRLKKKARVLGLEVNGKYKAYPLATLAKKILPYKDEFEGKTIWVQYEADTRSAYLTDENGAEIPTVSLYWFAWYAFHPQTTVLE